MAKVTVEIPKGRYCEGCLFKVLHPGKEKVAWMHGCVYLHVECEPEGEFQNSALKHKCCPGYKR